MAVSSGLFAATFQDILDVTGLSIDLTSDTDLKVALFTNDVVPNFDSDVGYGTSPYDDDEVSGTGYTAGGATLTGTTLTISSGVLVFDAADASWSSSTITGAEGALIYDDSQTSDNGIVLVDLGAAYSTSNGQLLISWSATGVARLDLVP